MADCFFFSDHIQDFTPSPPRRRVARNINSWIIRIHEQFFGCLFFAHTSYSSTLWLLYNNHSFSLGSASIPSWVTFGTKKAVPKYFSLNLICRCKNILQAMPFHFFELFQQRIKRWPRWHRHFSFLLESNNLDVFFVAFHAESIHLTCNIEFTELFGEMNMLYSQTVNINFIYSIDIFELYYWV